MELYSHRRLRRQRYALGQQLHRAAGRQDFSSDLCRAPRAIRSVGEADQPNPPQLQDRPPGSAALIAVRNRALAALIPGATSTAAMRMNFEFFYIFQWIPNLILKTKQNRGSGMKQRKTGTRYLPITA